MWSASYGTVIGSCAGGESEVTDVFEFPTDNGTLKLAIKGTYTFALRKGGIAGGDFDTDKMKGSFSFFPTKGDCIISPVTEFAAEGQGTLK